MDTRNHSRLKRISGAGALDLQSLARSGADYWKTRLIQRKYVDQLTSSSIREYSTRIEHAGVSFFFPLGTADADQAAAQALEIFSTVVAEGWGAACERFRREITVAVFWTWAPMACTYTTLYSLPGTVVPPKADPPKAAGSPCRVAVIESEDAVRRALAHWINFQPGFVCEFSCPAWSKIVRRLDRGHVDLILINRDLADRTPELALPGFELTYQGIPIFAFGVYEESNYIFHSVSGVKSGYLLHRRPPGALFEPVRRLGRERPLPDATLSAEVKKYFHGLFDLAPAEAKDPDFCKLTRRESDILNCLSQGLTDKEIAQALRISVWTVHGHVKSIFEKLRVHSRIEAVVKHLQK